MLEAASVPLFSIKRFIDHLITETTSLPHLIVRKYSDSAISDAVLDTRDPFLNAELF